MRDSRFILALLRKFAFCLQQMISLDLIGERILQELGEDGRISNTELANRVGLSPSACLRRVQEMERSGLIKGYRASIDRTKLGMGFLAYVAVGLSDHSKASQERFERAMADAPQVLECHNTTGSIEYLLRVEAMDFVAYKYFHTDILGALPQVNAITTYVVLGSPKDMRG